MRRTMRCNELPGLGLSYVLGAAFERRTLYANFEIPPTCHDSSADTDIYTIVSSSSQQTSGCSMNCFQSR